ncbi:MAG: hypothetical protein IPJ82_07705 [Lewinellaceae bacterium]|nr:hypothetical protein [Lewinellaceae bacterium]
MKNNFPTLLFLFLAFAQTTHAQPWNTTGGNSGAGLWLGTNDNNPLDIRTNSASRMYILSDGKIGINTNQPAAYLHVNGKLVTGTGTANFTVRCSSCSSGATAFTNTEFSALTRVAGIGGNQFTALYAKSGSHAQTAAAYFDGKVVVANGSLGIGTNAPIHTLDVNGRINVANGVIQRGGNAITSTSDLGLYSLTNGFHVRFVTNNAPFRFFSDGGTNPVGGTEVFSIGADGNTGIGTGAPEDKLQVGAGMTKIVMGSAYGANTGYGTTYIGFNASRQNASSWSTGNDGANNGGSVIFSDVAGNMLFSNIPNTGASNQSGIPDATILNNVNLFLGSNGSVGIGTRNTTGYKLAVNGFVRAKKVVVETGWSDFVFEKNYELMPLEEVERRIQEKGHLPGLPAAAEIEKDGADVGELLKLHMQKIEELTLYIIAQEKRIKELESQLKK